MSKFNDMLDWCVDDINSNPLRNAFKQYLDDRKCDSSHIVGIRVNRTTFNIFNETRPKERKGKYTYNGIIIRIDNTLPDNVYKFD